MMRRFALFSCRCTALVVPGCAGSDDAATTSSDSVLRLRTEATRAR